MPKEPIVIDLQCFAASLKTAWQAGETRPTHRRPYRRAKPYPKWPSMLEPYESQIKARLEAEPAIPAAVRQRLMDADLSRFKIKSHTLEIYTLSLELPLYRNFISPIFLWKGGFYGYACGARN